MPPWQLSEMEECILAIANHIDPLGSGPHPNLLTPGGKWRETRKANPQLISCLCTLSTLSQPSTLQVTPPLFGPFLLPHDHTPHFPSHPFPSWQHFPYIKSDCPVCLLLCSAISPLILGSNFQIPFILLPLAHLSFALSTLHLLLSSFLCTPIALCTQAQTIKCTHSYTSISLFLPPQFAAHIGSSVIED